MKMLVFHERVYLMMDGGGWKAYEGLLAKLKQWNFIKGEKRIREKK